MAAYYKVEVSLNTNSVTVGSPSAQEVLVTLPLVGPAGATGPQGPAGAGAVESVNAQTGVVVLDATDVGAAETLHASEHEIGGSDVLQLDSQQVLVDSVFLSTAAANLAGIYLRNGSDNGRPLYENAEYRTYFWWDSDLSKWFLANSSDVNLFESSSNTTFPWQATSWSPISPQTGSIDVDQAQLFDVSDQSIGNPSLLRTAKSGNATSTELVLGSDTRLTNSRTPSSTLAHAASHHTGGSDAVSAFSIGAESIFDASSNTLSGTPVTLTASRARVWTFPCFSATTVTLPTTGVELGDRIVVRGGSPVTATISISSTGVADTIQNADEQFSYTYLSTGIGNRWIKNLVDNHDAARVNSGTFANARINFAAPAAIGNTTPNTLAGTQLALHDGSDTGTFVAASKLTANRTYDLPDRSGTIVVSDTSAGSGSDVVNNIVSLTQAEYNAIGSPDAATLFLITDP
jgi:hypothetical protein